jgi:hypothetical protein
MRHAVILAVCLLAGCATMPGNIEGVVITDEERAECALTQKCAVWTEPQIVDLVRRAFMEGYNRARGGGNNNLKLQ